MSAIPSEIRVIIANRTIVDQQIEFLSFKLLQHTRFSRLYALTEQKIALSKRSKIGLCAAIAAILDFTLSPRYAQLLSLLGRAHLRDIHTTDNMATNMAMTNVNVSTAENTVVTGNANLDAGAQVVKEEKEKEDQLYADFPSDALPVSSQNQPAGTSSTDVNTNVNQTKRVDPRQDWINTDKTKPYYCKLCDYNMDCMEVGAFFSSKTEIKLRQINFVL